MSRKHFIALAEEIKDIRDTKTRKEAAVAVAHACKRMNNAFDWGRFMSACNVEE